MVILAEHDGKVVLVEQERVPIGRRCLELPAGLIGDEDENDNVEAAARRELEEETGFVAEQIEVLGEYYSSPGMVAESFTLVRATGLSAHRRRAAGWMARTSSRTWCRAREIAAFVAAKRAEGVGIDVQVAGAAGINPGGVTLVDDRRALSKLHRRFIANVVSRRRKISFGESMMRKMLMASAALVAVSGCSTTGHAGGRRRTGRGRRARAGRRPRRRSQCPTISCCRNSPGRSTGFRSGTRSRRRVRRSVRLRDRRAARARLPRSPLIPRRRPSPTPSSRTRKRASGSTGSRPISG